RQRTHLPLDKAAPHGRPIESPELGTIIPIPKSVASIIAMSDGRPDPAQSVRHDRACPRVRLLAAPPPKGPPSLGGGPTDPHCWPPLLSTVFANVLWPAARASGPSSTELDEVLAKDRFQHRGHRTTRARTTSRQA